MFRDQTYVQVLGTPFRMLLVVGIIGAIPELELLQRFRFTLPSHISPSFWLSGLLAQQGCLICSSFGHLFPPPPLRLRSTCLLRSPSTVCALPALFTLLCRPAKPPIVCLFLYTLTASSH